MSNQLQALLKERNITAQIQSRVKRLYSIHKKLVNQNSSIDKIFDLMALRVVTNSVEDCYLTLGVVHSKWIPIENRFRDWVTFPKPNGYRSIQTTVLIPNGDKFEIQIRTEEMHREAEYGTAAHWAYKERVSVDSTRIARLKEFLENDEYFDNPAALDQMLKSDAKRNFIHILTPHGELKTLPEGASALDFAFAIHTDVGLHATGARRNGKFAKLKTTLESGDIVEIITSKNAKPSRDWLSLVVSSGARSKIALWIKKNEKSEIESDGKRDWEKFKKRWRAKLDENEDEQSFKQNMQKIGFKNTDDFFAAIGMKSLKLTQSLLRKLYPKAFVKKVPTSDEVKRRNSSAKPELPIEVDGLRNIKTTLAKCCNPVKGEPIVGYFTKNVDLKIHSANCSYITCGNLDESRIKKANWISGDESTQSVRIQITGWQYSSLFSLAVEKAHDEKILIEGSERKTLNDSLDSLILTIQIKDSVQLTNYKNKLLSNSNVQTVRVVA
jgi:GTP pyrophosphokinase